MNALYGLGQALLHALDPERAHDLAVKSLELGLYPRQAAPDDPRLAQELWGLKFRNPLGMAAGFDKDARVWAPLLATGFGFVEVGTLTPKAQDGNPSPRIFRSARDAAIINRLGFNNEGQAAALPRLAATAKRRRRGEYRRGPRQRGSHRRLRLGHRHHERGRRLPHHQHLIAQHAWLARPAGAGGARCVARAGAGGAGQGGEAAAASRQARPRYRRCRPSGDRRRDRSQWRRRHRGVEHHARPAKG